MICGQRLQILDADQFHYLNQGIVHDEEEANDDIDDFFKTDDALSLLVDETEKIFVYTVITAILHLGNVDFDEEDGVAKVLSDDALEFMEYAALLLGIDIDDMNDTLVTKEVKVPGGTPIVHTMALPEAVLCARCDCKGDVLVYLYLVGGEDQQRSVC